jgi:hypothetical protein
MNRRQTQLAPARDAVRLRWSPCRTAEIGRNSQCPFTQTSQASYGSSDSSASREAGSAGSVQSSLRGPFDSSSQVFGDVPLARTGSF